MIFTIPFIATAAKSSVVTVCSGSIEFDHIIKKIMIDGSPIANENVRVKLFTSEDDDTPGASEPSGRSVIPTFAQTAYITLGSRKIELEFDYPGIRGHFLKLYVNNEDTVNSQTVYAYVTIEEREGSL